MCAPKGDRFPRPTGITTTMAPTTATCCPARIAPWQWGSSCSLRIARRRTNARAAGKHMRAAAAAAPWARSPSKKAILQRKGGAHLGQRGKQLHADTGDLTLAHRAAWLVLHTAPRFSRVPRECSRRSYPAQCSHYRWYPRANQHVAD